MASRGIGCAWLQMIAMAWTWVTGSARVRVMAEGAHGDEAGVHANAQVDVGGHRPTAQAAPAATAGFMWDRDGLHGGRASGRMEGHCGPSAILWANARDRMRSDVGRNPRWRDIGTSRRSLPQAKPSGRYSRVIGPQTPPPTSPTPPP